MADDVTKQDLTARAVTGDEDAIIRLLWCHYDRLAAHIAPQLPESLRGAVGVEDILQETFIKAWRAIGSFKAQGANSFFAWLAQIAKNTLLDNIKAQRRVKRGRKRIVADRSPSSVATLLEVLACDERTPSRVVRRREVEQALRVALAGLKNEYRQALQLRYMEGLPVDVAAARMNRTEGALHMLCHRAIEKLRKTMGSASKYLSSKS